MIAFATYASGPYLPVQSDFVKQALDHGARRVSMWRREDITSTEFYEQNRDILDRPRGDGYWLWKPYIILTELSRLGKGDVLIYSDVGKPHKPNRITKPLNILTDWCRDHSGGMLPGVYIPRHGANTRWIKGECFSVMGCEDAFYRAHPQIQATVSVWEKHDASMAFVSEWLEWCRNPAALLDDRIDPTIPNSPDFADHRHDQAVLTLLALKRGVKCMGSPFESVEIERRIDLMIGRINGDAPLQSFADNFPFFASGRGGDQV